MQKLSGAIFWCASFLVLVWQPGFAQDDEWPEAFESMLVVETDMIFHFGEILDMPMSYCNETHPDLVADPLCNGSLEWEFPQFWASITYTAEDGLGTWDAMYDISGALSVDKFALVDGFEMPYLEYVTISMEVDWVGAHGATEYESWYYELADIPPLVVPQGDAFYGVYGMPPEGSLVYSLMLKEPENIGGYLNTFFNFVAGSDPEYPAMEYADEVTLDLVYALEFDLVLYHLD